MTGVAPPAPGGRASLAASSCPGRSAGRGGPRQPGARNALTTVMYGRLRDICLELATDRSLRLVAVRGAGGVFAAGTDVADLRGHLRFGADGVAYEGEITRVLDAVRVLPVPKWSLSSRGRRWGRARARRLLRPRVRDARRPVRRPGRTYSRQLRLAGDDGSDPRRDGSRACDRAAAHRAVGDGGRGRSRAAGPRDRRARAPRRGGFRPAPRVSACAPLSLAAAKELGRRLDDQVRRGRPRGRLRHGFTAARTSRRRYGPFSSTGPRQWRGEVTPDRWS